VSVFKISSLCVLSVVTYLSSQQLMAEEWFEFRGPTGQGHSTEKTLPIEWSPTEHVLWKTDIPGVGLVVSDCGWRQSLCHDRGSERHRKTTRTVTTRGLPQSGNGRNTLEQRGLSRNQRDRTTDS